MSATVPQDAWARPLPRPDPDSQEYWAGLREGALRLQHCRDCGHIAVYHQAVCRQCAGTNLELRAACGRGTVYSFSVVHRAPGPAFKRDVPYAVLLVELDEGPRMISSLVNADPATVDFGMRVGLVCVPASNEVTLPRFEPLDAQRLSEPLPKETM